MITEDILGDLAWEDVPLIMTPSDLMHPESLALATRYELQMGSVMIDHLELVEEIRRTGGEILIDLGDPNLPMNVFQGYIRRTASSGLVAYELSVRDAIRFPVESGNFQGLINSNFYGFVRASDVAILGTIDKELYGQIGDVYKRKLGEFEKAQEQALERIVSR